MTIVRRSGFSVYHGRFAPSPTGPLHIGSFLTAVASFLDARSKQGCWHLRIDDLDTARNQPGAATRILQILESAGLTWDGPVLYQSQQLEKYQVALETLQSHGLLYRCTCSRKELSEVPGNASATTVYPGICRIKNSDPKRPHAIRIKITGAPIAFQDRAQGYFEQNLAAEVGDFILRRRDRIVAYQLAVVIDDASQQINHVVRGIDLIDSTPRQIYLHSLLGLPVPAYCHIPLLVDRQGVKLSKQTGAAAVQETQLSGVVLKVLQLLNHAPPKEMHRAPARELLQWGIHNWDMENLARSAKTLSENACLGGDGLSLSNQIPTIRAVE
ncbi:MAG: tRNA glutamyl-Q(34) synthetase GluQRS [Gammaproteobacteria bacterium]